MEMKRDSNYHAADRKIFIHGLHGKDGDDSSSWDSSDPEAVLNKLQGKPQVKGKKKDKDKVRSSADVDKDKYLKFADEKCRACGNIFMEDSVYCRKCGYKRPDEMVEVSSGSDEEKAKLRRDGLMWGLANEKGKERENSSEYYSAYVSIEGEDHKRHRKRIHNKVKDKAKKFGKLAAKAKLEKKEEKQKKKKALENDVDRETERREGVLQDMMQKKKKTKSKKDKDDSSSDEYESYYVSKDGSEH